MLTGLGQVRYRIVLDGNGAYRIQSRYAGFGDWTFDSRKFKTLEDAKSAINETTVTQVIEEL